MRGVVSLAAALALPLVTNSGQPFPGRDLIIFLTFCIILVTLVLQGLSLAPVIRWLGIKDDGSEEREEAKARLKSSQAALARLDQLSLEGKVHQDVADGLRMMYATQEHRYRVRFAGEDEDHHEDHDAGGAVVQPPAASSSLPSAKRSYNSAIKALSTTKCCAA